MVTLMAGVILVGMGFVVDPVFWTGALSGVGMENEES